ncbi:MAG: hypothetical protein ACO1NM_09305 [Sphingobium phenoxybenzoativorans]
MNFILFISGFQTARATHFAWGVDRYYVRLVYSVPVTIAERHRSSAGNRHFTGVCGRFCDQLQDAAISDPICRAGSALLRAAHPIL